MSYPKQTVQFRPIGFNLDLPPHEVPPEEWTDGDGTWSTRNGRMTAEFAAGAPAYTDFCIELNDEFGDLIPVSVQNMEFFGIDYWVSHFLAADTSESYSIAMSATGYVDVTFDTGMSYVANPSWWSTGVIGGVPFVNNRIDAPMYWSGDLAEKYVELPDWPTGVRTNILVAHKYHLFALGIDGSEEVLYWSDAAEPGSVPQTWTPGPGNQAGSLSLPVGRGFIAAADLRDSLIIYKRDTTYIADFVGGNEVYAFRMLFRSLGALNSRSVVDINGSHLVITSQDIVVHDSNTITSIGNNRIRRVLRGLSPEQAEYVHAVYIPRENEVWVFIPPVFDNSMLTPTGDRTGDIYVWDINNNKWSIRKSYNAVYATTVGTIGNADAGSTWDTSVGEWDEAIGQWNELPASPTDTVLILAGPTAYAGGVAYAPASYYTIPPEQFSTYEEIKAAGYPRWPVDFAPDSDSVKTSPRSGARITKAGIDFGVPERMKYIRRLHPRFTESMDPVLIENNWVRYSIKGSLTPQGDAISETSGIYNVNSMAAIDTSIHGRYFEVTFEREATPESYVWGLSGFDVELELRGYH